MPQPADDRHAILMTGFPGFIAGMLAERLLADERNFLYLLCVQPMLEAARARLATLGPGAADRCELLVGDITADTLGLDFRRRHALAGEVRTVYHLAAIYSLGTPHDIARRVNVEGTKNVLAFCRTVEQFDRLVYFSTAYVAGRRTGRVTEDECFVGQRFKNHYESTKCYAEEELRRQPDLPATVIRPGIVVGDTKTGFIPKYDGPYYTIRTFVAFERAGKMGRAKLFSIGGRDVPLYLVPVDFVADATLSLAARPEGLGTFHVLPSQPVTVRELLALLFEKFGVEPPAWRIPPWLMRLMFRLPGVEAMFQCPRQSLDYLDHDVCYDTMRLDAALANTGLSCPHPRDYLDTMIRFVREHPKVPVVR